MKLVEGMAGLYLQVTEPAICFEESNMPKGLDQGRRGS